jgi:hypothetical protein
MCARARGLIYNDANASHIAQVDTGTSMVIAVTFTPKHLRLVLDAIEARIEAQVAYYQTHPPSEDAAGDYGNDLHSLRLQRDELRALLDQGHDTATDYEAWFDPADSGLSLLRFQDVAAARGNGQLSDQAQLQYRFVAHSGEEAMAIHALRQGWAPYLPMGEAAPCPKCGANFYPEGYGDCWRCGHIG